MDCFEDVYCTACEGTDPKPSRRVRLTGPDGELLDEIYLCEACASKYGIIVTGTVLNQLDVGRR